jgi:hypothetical protein
MCEMTHDLILTLINFLQLDLSPDPSTAEAHCGRAEVRLGLCCEQNRKRISDASVVMQEVASGERQGDQQAGHRDS